MEILKLGDLKAAKGNRKIFDKQKMEELKKSIQEKGVITPLLVRPVIEKGGQSGQYEIVNGARRYTAAQELKLKGVPCIIREMADEEAAQVRIIENLQREDLGPIEEAQEIERMTKEFGKKPGDIADRISKPVSYIKARLQLLVLPEHIKKAISEGAITANHGAVLARIPGQKKQNKLLDIITERKLSANAAENYLEKSGKDINDAPFNTAECKKCPNLGKNQSGLFDKDTDIDSICLDGSCWVRKVRESGRKASGSRKASGKKQTYQEALQEAVIEKIKDMPLSALEMLARTAGVDCTKVKESLEPAKKLSGDKLAEKARKMLPQAKTKKILVTKATVKGKDGAELTAEAKKAADVLAGTFAGKK